MLNVHHLELFYYVARHGGIAEAVRHMPYGIQQPAMSSQILQLEDSLGTKLFERRPFKLTPAGEKLFEFIQPFFGELDRVEKELRSGPGHHLRIGASEVVLREHLPIVSERVRARYPKLQLSLRDASHPQIETWLERREIDMAITLLDSRKVPGITALPILKLPLVLMLNKKSSVRSLDELWKADRIEETLICLPANEVICKRFQEFLSDRKLDWPRRMEVSSLELVATYVENGYGAGLSVLRPGSKLPSNLRVHPLKDAPTVDLGVLWHGQLSQLSQVFLEEIQKRANEVRANFATIDGLK